MNAHGLKTAEDGNLNSHNGKQPNKQPGRPPTAKTTKRKAATAGNKTKSSTGTGQRVRAHPEPLPEGQKVETITTKKTEL